MSFVARGAIRSVKNVAKGYTDIQIKVREATSNNPGPVNTELMRQIASASHYDQLFVEIMIIMEKRLNDDGRKWRHVYKALVLLEYLLVSGSERIFQYAKDNFYVIKTLIEFQYTDEIGVDHGQNVRIKAKKVSELLTGPESLAMERNARKNMDARRDSSRNMQNHVSLSQREENDINQAIQESLKTSTTTTIRSQTPKSAHHSDMSAIEGMSELEQIQRAIELSQADQQQQSSSSSSSHKHQHSSNPQPLIDLLGGDDHHSLTSVQHDFTGDPFALPQGNPFAMLDSQPTGTVFINNNIGQQNPGNPFSSMQYPQQQHLNTQIPQGTGFVNVSPEFSGWANVQPQPTGWTDITQHPTGYTNYAQHPIGYTNYAQQPNGFANNIQQQSTGFTNIPQNPTGYTAATSTTTNPFSTKSPPIVDLDNLVGPPNRNPFAVAHHQTGPSSFGNGGFNWTNSDSSAPKPSLAQMAMQQQQHPVLNARTGPQVLMNNQGSARSNTPPNYMHVFQNDKPVNNNNNPFF